MLVDKDKPSTWKIFKQKNCDDCMSYCCSMPVEVDIEDLIQLELISRDEVEDSFKKLIQRLKKEKWIRSYRDSTGLFILEHNPQGDCLFLDKNRRCTVYDKRPKVCRKFPALMGLKIGYCPVVKKTK